jgi:ABC-2 type transport system permease protein
MSTLVMARELRLAVRDRRAPWLLAAVLAIGMAGVLAGLAQAARWERETTEARQGDVAVWTSQGARNPHSAAHFGRHAFRPVSPLAHFDPGLTDFLGRGIWIEAHYQNPAAIRPAEDAGPLGRLGRLSAAWVLQLGLPILVVLAGFGIYAEERQSGRLRLQLASGAGTRALFAGKAGALTLVAAALWLPFALVLLATADETARALTAIAGYALYALAFVGLTLAVSAAARDARTALVALLAVWLATVFVVPRIATAVGESIAPSPDPQAFWRDVRDGLASGVDGHSSTEQRRAELLARTLAEYGVTREDELPVNFSGIALQASEEHGNAVFDRYYGEVWATYARQEAVRVLLSATSPLLAVEAVSQRAAGTDWRHHRHFVDRAEAYRRELQRFLNGDLARHGRPGRPYEADPALWARAPEFDYRTPRLAEIGHPSAALAALLAWAVAAWACAAWNVRRLVRAGGA